METAEHGEDDLGATPDTSVNRFRSDGSPNWEFPEGERVVLFDLDGTLIKSEEGRKAGWERALSQLTTITGRGIDELLPAYEAIYKCHANITGEVGPQGHKFEDVRQMWNTRTSYALLIAWSALGFPRGARAQKANYVAAFKELFNDSNQWGQLIERAEHIRHPWSIEYTTGISQAQEQFRQGKWETFLFPGVTKLLSSLRRNGVQYYVATEGDVPTQWAKISAVGLDKPDPEESDEPPLITPKQLLATSQAARPQHELDAVKALIGWFRGRAAGSRAGARVLSLESAFAHRVSEFQLAADAAELTANGLDKIVKLFARLAKKFNIDSSGHVQPEFFARILYAINQSPTNPHQALDEFRLRWDDERRIRVAMVGDKFESDVHPILELAREQGTKIMSIWVRQGTHGNMPAPVARSVDWVECETIKEAGEKYLLNESEWRSRTECIGKPKRLFVSAIEAVRSQEESSNQKSIPTRSSPVDVQETIIELLAGIAGVRSQFDQRIENAPDRATVKKAETFVSRVVEHIVADVRLSKSRNSVIETLLAICSSRASDALLSKCTGLPRAAVDFLLSVATPETDNEYREYLVTMGNLLEIAHADWAAAVIELLADARNGAVFSKIRDSADLRGIFLRKLEPLEVAAGLPDGFPRREALFLATALRAAEPRASSSTPPLASPAPGA